ncbi:zinc finger and BTB domain-containing protein 26 [Latimeria chalumnae]|uniref:zinc finger and BTB domain-containing protein 26 n=1 Tax=Latimeria chalumnae TaxID=7897 RepID=UPI0006D8E26D|nr:PREDICTED: zinc finger and BTB domain-containing protein 26 [Latimeria chalumnae]|eukprot:XP_014350742.1 PREDICTED: zinc finger and BTB domain-containing protein 26 [Latimeria chalumnae]
MAQSSFTSSKMADFLHFKFENYGDSMLQKMDKLREENKFCDVTVHIDNVKVHGHKVVFAAGSPFLRDQFLLNESDDVQISIFQNSEVGRRILLSCYTGILEFPELELVNYLTVASFLQMGQVVEKCVQALSKFIKPKEQIVGKGIPSELQVNQEKRQDISLSSSPSDPEDDNMYADDSDIQIVKVESIGEVSNVQSSNLQNHFISSAQATLPSSEPQHSVINSTVESKVTEREGTSLQSVDVTNDDGNALTVKEILASNRGLDKELQWHHKCPKCTRVFRHLENYAHHLKMHKLFMCLLCGNTFTQKGNLHRHMRVHAGIKPFQCKICGKTFSQKCSLQDHLNLHSGDKPHKCNYCDMVFAHKPVLRKHLKQIHGKNSFDNANERNIQDVTLEIDSNKRLSDTDDVDSITQSLGQ